MQTSVNLQELYTYSIIPLLISIFLIIILTVYLLYLKNSEKEINIKKYQPKAISEKNIKNIPVIKTKFLKELDSTEYKYTNNIIELRQAYQDISEIIRMFVFEITDITTQNYCLAEIEKLNIPNLYELIKEYYEPEFASKSIGDFDISINKARRVINEWN